MEENRSFQEKIRLLEEKNATIKITVQNLKSGLKDKEFESNRARESITQFETLKADNNSLLKKLDEQTKKIKHTQSELE